ncbi:hypothetical protein MUK42_33008 [Musa troglodytarum]|uniref:Uncharacterized protein n=1 Tax=Musa troglodytarum TaxID=320322 RepID=A0A9E7F326_9LILI|nr:hypothetical protein MUK42_33008 [Musa troglodytarum]
MDVSVAEASALAISLILYLSSTQLVRLWCVCGYHLYGAHMMQLVKDALILNVSLMRLVMLWCLCGYYLCGAHTDPTVFPCVLSKDFTICRIYSFYAPSALKDKIVIARENCDPKFSTLFCGKGDGHLVLHGHVTIDFGKRDKFLKEEVPLTGYLIVDYFPYRTTSVGLLVAEASTFAIILQLLAGQVFLEDHLNVSLPLLGFSQISTLQFLAGQVLLENHLNFSLVSASSLFYPLDVKRDISCIYLLLTEDIEWFTFVSVLQYDHVVGTSSGSLYCLYVLGASEQQNCREGKFRIVEKENSDGYAKEAIALFLNEALVATSLFIELLDYACFRSCCSWYCLEAFFGLGYPDASTAYASFTVGLGPSLLSSSSPSPAVGTSGTTKWGFTLTRLEALISCGMELFYFHEFERFSYSGVLSNQRLHTWAKLNSLER